MTLLQKNCSTIIVCIHEYMVTDADSKKFQSRSYKKLSYKLIFLSTNILVIIFSCSKLISQLESYI